MIIVQKDNWQIRWNNFGWRWPHTVHYRHFTAYYFGPLVLEVE